jgi:tyrosinase
MATGTPRPQTLASPLKFRRSVARLTPGQLENLRAAFSQLYAIDDDRGYSYWAGIHGLPLPIGCDSAHGTEYFLPWHRAYLYFFERAMRDRVPDAMLTWWDWRTPPGREGHVPDAYSKARANRRKNPLRSAAVDPLALQQGRRWPPVPAATTERDPGGAGVSLPSAQEVTDALRIRDFIGFSAQVEDLHNRVHMWVGGHMGQIPYAAFDPIFWAHHTMIDRLWRLWQLRHVGGRPPASILDQALPPFRMTVAQTLDVTALGYDYAVHTTSARPV